MDIKIDSRFENLGVRDIEGKIRVKQIQLRNDFWYKLSGSSRNRDSTVTMTIIDMIFIYIRTKFPIKPNVFD